jgi:hypothetical protein
MSLSKLSAELLSLGELSNESRNFIKSMQTVQEMKALCELLSDPDSRRHCSAKVFKQVIDLLSPPAWNKDPTLFDLFLRCAISQNPFFITIFDLDVCGSMNFIPSFLKTRYTALLPCFPFEYTTDLLDMVISVRPYMSCYVPFLKDGVSAECLKNITAVLKASDKLFVCEPGLACFLAFYLTAIWNAIEHNPHMVESKEHLDQLVILYRSYIEHRIHVHAVYFEISTDIQIGAWLHILGERDLMSLEAHQIKKMVKLKFHSDILNGDQPLTPAHFKVEEILKAGLEYYFKTNNSDEYLDFEPKAMYDGLHQNSQAEILKLLLSLMKAKKMANINRVLSSVGLFDGKPEYFAEFFKTSIFRDDFELHDKLNCLRRLNSLNTLGRDPLDWKHRRVIVENYWKYGEKIDLRRIFKIFLDDFPLESRFFESRKKDWRKATTAYPTQMKLILPSSFTEVLDKLSSHHHRIDNLLAELERFPQSGLPLFASPEEEKFQFYRLISSPDINSLLVAAFFFNGPEYSEILLKKANEIKSSDLRLIVGSRMSCDYSHDIRRWITEEELLAEPKYASLTDFRLLPLLKIFAHFRFDSELKKIINEFFDNTVRYWTRAAYRSSEVVCMKYLVLKQTTDPDFTEKIKAITIDSSQTALSYLIAENWGLLSKELSQTIIATKLLELDPRSLINWLPVICKAVESFPENLSLQNLLAKVVSYVVYRGDILCVVEAIRRIALPPSVRIQLAAHWFLVDTMKDICELDSAECFVGVLTSSQKYSVSRDILLI